MSLTGRVALVTGGHHGIGRAIALGLADDGADVTITYRREEAAAQSCVEAIRGLGRRSLCVRAEVDDPDQIRAAVDAVEAEFSAVDILVNNAGLDFRGANVTETTPEELLLMMQVNALAPHLFCNLVLPRMRTRPRGDIVMISSTVTRILGAGYAPYGMSKAALEALASVLAKEEYPHGVHVNIVSPGLVETGMGIRYAQAQGDDDMRRWDERVPYGHVCQPEEVADVVRYLVSSRASYLNGQRIYVDGGAP